MRMQGNPSQMPPAPGTPPSGTEITTVSNWIAAGYPAGACGTTTSPPPPDPFGVAPKCTSNSFWTQGNTGSPLMNPGLSCLGCHTGGGGDDSGGGNSGPGGGGDDNGGGGGDDSGGGGEAPLYTIAGTLYPSAHEPDLCNGSDGEMNGARVVIVDAANQTITLTPNAAGNFFYAGAVSFPFHAKVTFQGRERIMTAAQSNGSCNGCHTQAGANGATGADPSPLSGRRVAVGAQERAPTIGRRTVNAVPRSRSVSTSIRPPWSATMRATVASPSPVPPGLVE
jgi:mono/diheme cytochrome c family protein